MLYVVLQKRGKYSKLTGIAWGRSAQRIVQVIEDKKFGSIDKVANSIDKIRETAIQGT